MGLFLTDKNCIRQREYVNIPAWQEAGYQGEGLTIFHDDVEKTHSECCTDIISTILPKARVLSGSISCETERAVVTKCSVFCRETRETLPFAEFIEKYDVSQINNSTSGKASNDLNTPIAVYMREMIRKYNLFCTGSAGNHDSKNNRYKGAFVMVSGVYFYKDTERIMDYGPAWDFVDFSMFMTFQTGTSFSAPFLNAMAGLLRCRYGRTITQEEIYQYFADHCVHFGTPGKNPEYGYGIPVLGDPREEYFGGGKEVRRFQSLPVDGPLRVTSPYGKRSTSIAGASSWHRGIDLGGVRNRDETKVLSVLPGKVKQNYWNDYRGNVIVIDHGDGMETLYQHLRERPNLEVGTKVAAGSVIGIMGNSSNPKKLTVAVHLHFEVHINGTETNPLPYLENVREERKMTKFDDVKAGAWYEEAVAFCSKREYMRGVSETEFRPNEPLTRAQAAQIIYNMMKEK